MSEGFVSSLGKPSASKCSCPSWPLGDRVQLFRISSFVRVIPRALCSQLNFTCLSKGYYSQIRTSGNGGTSYVLTTALRRRDGNGLSGAPCLLCLPSPVPAQRKRPSLDRALCMCCVEGQIGASGHTVKPSTRPSLPASASQSTVKSPPQALSPAVHLGLWLPPAKNSPCCVSWQPLSPSNPKLGDPDLCMSTLISGP